MNYEQFKDIIIKIESNCLKFKLEDYQAKFWWNKLKEYDYVDINHKLDQHFNSEYSSSPPALSFLVKNVLTLEQKSKQNNKKLFVKCPICHKKYEYPIDFDDWKKCHQRCRMIQNIVTKSLEFNIDIIKIFGSDVGSMKLSDIDKNYVKFLSIVFDKGKDKLSDRELNALKMVLKTYPNKNQQLNLLNE